MKKLLVTILLMFPLQSFASQESWYLNFSLGAARNEYPANIGVTSGRNRVEGSGDMFGVYFPMISNLAIGFAVTGSFDRFDTPAGYHQINQYLAGFSTMKFFGKEIGDGIFLRGDIGLAKWIIDDEKDGITSSKPGLGVLVGAGFGIPVTEGFRVLFGLNVSNKEIDGKNWKATTFNIGGLW